MRGQVLTLVPFRAARRGLVSSCSAMVSRAIRGTSMESGGTALAGVSTLRVGDPGMTTRDGSSPRIQSNFKVVLSMARLFFFSSSRPSKFSAPSAEADLEIYSPVLQYLSTDVNKRLVRGNGSARYVKRRRAG